MQVKLQQDEMGRANGKGYVEFATEEDKRAAKEKNGCVFLVAALPPCLGRVCFPADTKTPLREASFDVVGRRAAAPSGVVLHASGRAAGRRCALLSDSLLLLRAGNPWDGGILRSSTARVWRWRARIRWHQAL